MAFEYTKMIMRQPSFLTHQRRYQSVVRKSMREYRALHTQCEYSGKTKRLEVHHVYPVSSYPWLAALHSNMQVLEKKVHLHAAHAGDYKAFVENFPALCETARIQRTTKWVAPTKEAANDPLPKSLKAS